MSEALETEKNPPAPGGRRWGAPGKKMVRASPGSGLRLLNLSRCLSLQQDLGPTATSAGPKSTFKVAGVSRCEYADHTQGPSVAVWAVPACNSTKESLLGVPIVSHTQPSPERVSGPGPPSSRHRSSNTKVWVAGPSSILAVTPGSPGAGCAKRNKGSCSEGRQWWLNPIPKHNRQGCYLMGVHSDSPPLTSGPLAPTLTHNCGN